MNYLNQVDDRITKIIEIYKERARDLETEKRYQEAITTILLTRKPSV